MNRKFSELWKLLGERSSAHLLPGMTACPQQGSGPARTPVKPFDRETVVREAGRGRLVVTLENHSVIGGLAESVASCLAPARTTARIVPVGLADVFLAAGALPTLHDRYGLSVEAIKDRVRREL
ncbi:1-deoxy-D-xylulose-5-phosphate synthase [Streptomyces alboniger]